MKHKAIILWSLLGVVGAAMLAGIVAVVLPSRYVDERVLFTIMIVGAYALGGLVIVAVGPKRMRWTMRACAVSLAISMLIYIALIWGDDLWNWRIANMIGRYTSVILIIGIVLAHRLMIAPLRMPTTVGWVVKRGALIAAAIAGAIMCFGLITNGFFDWEDLFIRLFGVSVIIASGSSIATGAFAIFGPKAGEDEPGLLAGSIPVALSCPRCNTAIDVQSNRDGRCSGCRLKVRVEIEEPRCVCGYLLYELESDTCPECGKLVPERDRWKST